MMDVDAVENVVRVDFSIMLEFVLGSLHTFFQTLLCRLFFEIHQCPDLQGRYPPVPAENHSVPLRVLHFLISI